MKTRKPLPSIVKIPAEAWPLALVLAGVGVAVLKLPSALDRLALGVALFVLSALWIEMRASRREVAERELTAAARTSETVQLVDQAVAELNGSTTALAEAVEVLRKDQAA